MNHLLAWIYGHTVASLVLEFESLVKSLEAAAQRARAEVAGHEQTIAEPVAEVEAARATQVATNVRALIAAV